MSLLRALHVDGLVFFKRAFSGQSAALHWSELPGRILPSHNDISLLASFCLCISQRTLAARRKQWGEAPTACYWLWKRKEEWGENILVQRVQCCQWCRWPASFSMKSSVHDWVGDKTSTSRGFILKGLFFTLIQHFLIVKPTVKTVTFLDK